MNNKLSMLNTAKDLFFKGENVLQYLNKEGYGVNSISDIQISYDLQAGSYITHYEQCPEFRDAVYLAITKVLDNLKVENVKYVLEAGVGEAVALGKILSSWSYAPETAFAFDLSWSRIKCGQAHLKKIGIDQVQMFVGDMFHAPIKDNSIDIVYTIHAIEPNGGREREALIELYRMAAKYIVLFEPAYELADQEAKERMRSHGYITNLYETAKELGYIVEEYRLLGTYLNPLNPTGVMIIRKEEEKSLFIEGDYPLCCPITKAPLKEQVGLYYAEDSMLAYPIIHGVPCMMPNNAVVATQLNRFL
jgi:uncharacterized protein YbaR (Trm112 family)